MTEAADKAGEAVQIALEALETHEITDTGHLQAIAALAISRSNGPRDPRPLDLDNFNVDPFCIVTAHSLVIYWANGLYEFRDAEEGNRVWALCMAAEAMTKKAGLPTK